MKVLVYEDNLMWSVRLAKGVSALGHEPIVLTKPEVRPGDVAIVNLGSDGLDPAHLVAALRAGGTYVIGHAGHKEGGLLDLGRQAGCSRVATNSELTFKLPDLLAAATNE